MKSDKRQYVTNEYKQIDVVEKGCDPNHKIIIAFQVIDES